MSSPVRILGPVSAASRSRNAKRRILSDSEDTEERDPKRVKPLETADDQGKGQDTKEKKRRRKKKRKVPVVESAPESDAESPSVATKPTLSRVRSRSMTISDTDGVAVASPSKMTRDDTRQPSAGPSSMPELEAKLQLPIQDRDQTSPPPLAPSTVRGVICLSVYALRLRRRLLRPLRAWTKAKAEPLRSRLLSRMSRSSLLTFRSKLGTKLLYVSHLLSYSNKTCVCVPQPRTCWFAGSFNASGLFLGVRHGYADYYF